MRRTGLVLSWLVILFCLFDGGARLAGFAPGLDPRSMGAGWTSPKGATYPYGSTPRSAGEFRSQRSTSGTATSAAAATSSEAARHPERSVRTARNGRKIS